MRNLGEFFTGCAVATHALTGTYLAKRNGEMYRRSRRVAAQLRATTQAQTMQAKEDR